MTYPRAQVVAVVGEHRVPGAGGVDDVGVEVGDRDAVLGAEPDERAALGVVDGGAAAEVARPAPAGEAGEHDVHAVLDRAGGVVEVATVLGAGEVRRAS